MNVQAEAEPSDGLANKLHGAWKDVSGFLSSSARYPAALLFTLIAGHGALGVIDGTFALMHKPGSPAQSATGALSAGAIGSTPTYQLAIDGWLRWHSYFGDHLGQAGMRPENLMALYAVIDIVFVALPVAGLLFAAIGYARTPVETHPRSAALLPVLSWALFATTVYFIADCAEDLSLLGMVWFHRSPFLWVWVTGWISLAKLTFLGLAVLGCAIGLIAAVQVVGRDALAVRWRVLLALRLQVAITVLLLAFLGLGSDLGRQLDDAFMLLFERPSLLLATLAAAVLVAAAMRSTAALCLAAYRSAPGKPDKHAKLVNIVVLVSGVVAFAVGLLALLFHWRFFQVLMVPGAIAVLLAVPAMFGRMGAIASKDLRKPVTLSGPEMLRGVRHATYLAVTPFVVLLAMSLRIAVRLATAHNYGLAGGAVALLLVLLAAAAGMLRWSMDPPENAPVKAIAWLVVAAGLIFVVMGAWPRRTGELLGAWAVLFMLAAALTLGLAALVLVGDAFYPGNVLAACGLSRLPIIGILAVSMVITSIADDQSVYHSTRLKPVASGAPPSLETVSDALTAWRGQQSASPQPVPLVFVASAGGGIRAAYWTTLVLNCIVSGPKDFDKPAGFGDSTMCAKENRVMPATSIFLASGISGGSLGLAVTQVVDEHNNWPTPLRRDFLGPAIAGMAFRDIPNALLRISAAGHDRAAVLEDAWENAVSQVGGDLEAGFMATARPNGTGHLFPLLALNGTSVTDGCRVTVSALRLSEPAASADDASHDCLSLDGIVSPMNPSGRRMPAMAGTKDAFDRTCPADEKQGGAADLRLSTAALLSARFPYVSPTGTLFWCKERGVRTFDLDGGVIDASGAGPLALIWPEVLRWMAAQKPGMCFAPKLILIENGYAVTTGSTAPNRPPELTAPLTAVGAVRDAESSQARQAAALAFEKAFPLNGCTAASTGTGWTTPNVVDFHPVEYPGVEAPLGWTLSKLSQESLDRQLHNDYNECSAAIVAQWFDTTGRPPSRPLACPDPNAPKQR